MSRRSCGAIKLLSMVPLSASSCSCWSGSGPSVVFDCSDNCDCGGGCQASGTGGLEDAEFAVTGGVCRCSRPDEPHDDPPPPPGAMCPTKATLSSAHSRSRRMVMASRFHIRFPAKLSGSFISGRSFLQATSLLSCLQRLKVKGLELQPHRIVNVVVVNQPTCL